VKKPSGGRGRALVTGASRGIGKAVAKALVEKGWDVIGTCRNPRELAPADRIPGVSYVPLDLAREASIDSLTRSLTRAAGGVDVLVNNAGESPLGPAEEIPIKDLRAYFQVNFFGPARLTQGFLPGMRARRNGLIVFVGSIRSEVPTPFSSAYSAAKAAIKSFGECLRLELMGTGVRVAVAAPWYVRTGFPQKLMVKEGSPYAGALKNVKKVRDEMISKSQDPDLIARRVLRLVEAKDPPAFTVMGRRFLTFFIHHAPRRMVAAMSARTTGMRPVQERSFRIERRRDDPGTYA